MSGFTRLLFILVFLSVGSALALAPERHITELVHRVWDSKSGVPADIRALAQTTDGYLWVGSLRGLYRFDGTQFRRYEPESGAPLPSQQIRSLFAAPNDRLWIGYRKGGVSVLEAGKLINYNSVDGFPEGNVKRFARDQQGRIWAASSGGLASFDGRRWHTVGSESGFPGSRASMVFVDHRGALWVAGEHRIAVLPSHASRFELADEPYTGQVYDLAESPDGTVWMAETTRAVRPLGRLLTITEGRLHLYSSKEGLPPGEIKAIDSVGTHVWVGGDAGLVLLRGPRFTPVLPYDAPAFGSVSGIVETDDGSLWVNENRGVIRISAADVAAILQDSSHRAHYDLFNSLDGLSGATEQVTTPTAIRGTDGRLWFTTTNGAAWVDPRHLYRNKLPPPVVIQSIVADGQTTFPSSKLELPGKTTHLQIAYAGLSFSVPERVQFRYRLQGLDQEWQSAGTRRTADYTKLAPGSYDFQVIASNDAGVWNEAGAHLALRIVPAWYQTGWFYALCALLVAAALAGLFRLRLAQARADTRRLLEARLAERERIARELHDSILQGFQGLMFRLQAVRYMLPERPGDAAESLDSAMRVGDLAIGEGRDAVQSLRSSSVDDRDLATSLSTLGTELGVGIPSESRPEYSVVVEGRPRELAVNVRDDVYRIVREAVRNAYQHAKARHIETELHFRDSDLCIRVRDDGVGVDSQVLAQGQRPGHWGLPGMRERSANLGGCLQVWSKANAGTEIELRIPAKIAYAQRSPSTTRRLRGLFSWRPWARVRSGRASCRTRAGNAE